MATTIKPSSSSSTSRVTRGLWHTPTSKAALFWFLFAFLYCLLFYVLYAVLFNAHIFTGPWFDRVFRVGVMSYIAIVAVSAYSLRTRFLHNMPWKAQNWVWMHIWIGLAAVFLALLHAAYAFVTYWDCKPQQNCIIAHFWGMPSLYGLIFIVLSGIVGRLLDMWQTRVIARDASTNGVGIAKAIRARLVELRYVIERYTAGKSEPFKNYCAVAMQSIGQLPVVVPTLAPQEQPDFQRAHAALQDHARLAASLRQQEMARRIFKVWRYIHMSLVPLALIIITYHGVAELLVNVLHVMK